MRNLMLCMFMVLFICVVSADASEMIIRYNDGTVQKIQLRKSPSSIIQITIGDGYDPYSGGTINVVSGSYGLNCGALYGNKTRHLASQCNGRESCSYRIDVNVIGDPAIGCAKEYIAEWRCGTGPIRSIKVPSEAGNGSIINLTCQQY